MPYDDDDDDDVGQAYPIAQATFTSLSSRGSSRWAGTIRVVDHSLGTAGRLAAYCGYNLQ